MDEFVRWLNAELEFRSWSYSEAARRGGFASSMFTHIANGSSKPGLDFCRGISKAFGIPLEDVFRLAEILPPVTDDNPTVAQLLRRLRMLPATLQQQVVSVMHQVIGLAQAQSPSTAPPVQFQSLEEAPAWFASLGPDVQAAVLEAMETTFPAGDSARRTSAEA